MSSQKFQSRSALAVALISLFQVISATQDYCQIRLYPGFAPNYFLHELDDGQLRYSTEGSVSVLNFHPKAGVMYNTRQFGCILAGNNVQQVQCDQGKQPMRGFSLSPSNELLYHGQSSFFMCPASETVYNLYVNPNFHQDKCVPVNIFSTPCQLTQQHNNVAPPPPISAPKKPAKHDYDDDDDDETDTDSDTGSDSDYCDCRCRKSC